MESFIHLSCQIAIIIGWVSVACFTIMHRKQIDVNSLYRVTSTSIVLALTLLSEAHYNDWDMSWNLWYWYPINIMIQHQFYTSLKYRIKCNNMMRNFMSQNGKHDKIFIDNITNCNS